MLIVVNGPLGTLRADQRELPDPIRGSGGGMHEESTECGRQPLPPQYEGWEKILLDIYPKVKPDVLCDARQLTKLPAGMYDGVYCSHNLEHYYRHDVPKVLAGFPHVLKDRGFAHIIVPDMGEVMRTVVRRGSDIDDMLFESPLERRHA
jgi:predicted SAM-dependent methyltransferase